MHPELLPFHDPRRRAATLERAVQVHVQHPLPLLVAELDDRDHVLAQPGAVHEDVEPPARLRDLGEQRVHLGGRRHVQAGGCRGQPLAGERGGDRLGLLSLQVRDEHRGAPGRQGFRDAPSESLGRSGDHRHLTGQGRRCRRHGPVAASVSKANFAAGCMLPYYHYGVASVKGHSPATAVRSGRQARGRQKASIDRLPSGAYHESA